ncbi:molybdopterin-dependent oxidoreductase [Piscinibacter sp. XHJ-5]|uniref:molybdopterin-dependent oxidoreductase n=1 Tax=Piscinibacter sp. XHJ-5 TaxID=3037797 RepID=UPI002452BD9A|nr:molybdopterin-dependent oxidoreductase [Piscinibacter sp. XHJ-5]
MTAFPVARRPWLLWALASALAAPAAGALDAPAGRVVLTVTGEIEQRNAPDGAQFDMAMLEKLPQRSYSTRTPWYPEPRKFTGVLLRDLLAAVGARGKTVKAVALNDYRVDIPVEDAARHDLMVAYRLDDKPMAVRDKGPLVVIYPFDAQPELRSAVNYSRAAWQLKQLELR